MYKIVNDEILEMTEEEIQQLRQEQAAFEAYEKKRPLTQAEVFQIMTKQTLNTLDIDDQTALRMVAYYPTFNEVIGQKVKNGFKFTHDGQLYRCTRDTGTAVYNALSELVGIYVEVVEES